MSNRAIRSVLFILLLIFSACPAQSQSYHAINGSPYAGATGMYINPANTVNSAFKWDLTLLSFQFYSSNSAFQVNNASVSDFNDATIQATNGYGYRFFHSTIDMNFLNLRLNIGNKKAIAFGVRGRMYNHVKTMPFSYSDTITGFQGFLHANTSSPYLEGYATHTGWVEANINYSQVLYETESSRLSAGITIGLQKSLSGAHMDIKRVSYTEQVDSNKTYYIFTGGGATAEYSSNYDNFIGNAGLKTAVKSFLENTSASLNLSVGIEWLFKKPEDETVLSPLHYSWKIGLSLMDIGTSKYQPANGSFTVRMPQVNTTDTLLQRQLANAGSIGRARDSLTKSFTTVDSLSNPFTISDPTRLILSVDKELGPHFYVNGELVVNFFSTQPQEKLKTRDLNLLTITPRWETYGFGAYLPVQYNTQGQLWVGGAIKLGPLIIGVHSLDMFRWFKKETQTFNGGGYLLLRINPFSKKQKELYCPPS